MLELLHTPAILIASCALLGLVVGSFLNVVIHRLPRMLEAQWQAEAAAIRGEETPQAPRYNLLVPRSACPGCGHQIGTLENIPLFSYLALGGKCSKCKTKISPRYPLVELLSAALCGAVAWKFGYGLATLASLFFVWIMIALTFIDLDTQLLPDSLTLALLWLGLAINLDGPFTSLPNAVMGAMAGYLALWSVYWAFKLITGKEGMGYGDFKLLAAIGAWLGWAALPIVILLSSVVGAAVGIALIVFTKHGRNVPIPFGPYLAAAGLIALFFGAELTQILFAVSA